jgi:type IV pilus biogenesis protein CpaD/CtpE
MKKAVSILSVLIILMMSGSALCFADDAETKSNIPNYTEHAAPKSIESGDSQPIVNLNEEPNGKKITHVEQAVIEVTTVKSNTQGQGN